MDFWILVLELKGKQIQNIKEELQFEYPLPEMLETRSVLEFGSFFIKINIEAFAFKQWGLLGMPGLNADVIYAP